MAASYVDAGHRRPDVHRGLMDDSHEGAALVEFFALRDKRCAKLFVVALALLDDATKKQPQRLAAGVAFGRHVAMLRVEHRSGRFLQHLLRRLPIEGGACAFY